MYIVDSDCKEKCGEIASAKLIIATSSKDTFIMEALAHIVNDIVVWIAWILDNMRCIDCYA